jgi:hypothetical protein
MRNQSLWLTDDQRLEVQACLLSGPEAIAAWNHWSHHDLVDLDGEAERMLPLLYRNLSASGAPVKDLEKLRAAYRSTIARNRLFLRPALEAVALLDELGVGAVLLKGAAMITPIYYGDIGIRTITDVDVLIPHDQARLASNALVAAGWVPDDTRSLERCLRDYHAVNLAQGRFGSLDLHWNLLVTARDTAADAAMIERSVATTLDDRVVRVLDPADHLLHICANATPRETRWITDVVTIIRRCPELDWDRFVEDLGPRRLVSHVHRSLVTTDQTTPGVIPPDVLHRLEQAPRKWSDRVTAYPPGGTSRRQGLVNLAVLATQRSRNRPWSSRMAQTRDVVLEAAHATTLRGALREGIRALRGGTRSHRGASS